MAKKLGLTALLAVITVTFSGCAAGGGDFFYRGWKHFEWHVLGAYKDLTQLHRDRRPHPEKSVPRLHRADPLPPGLRSHRTPQLPRHDLRLRPRRQVVAL